MRIQRWMGVLTAAAALAATAGPAAANDGMDLSAQVASSPITITAYWENDSRPLKANNPHDGHYTNGGALTATHRPPWAKRFADRLGLADETDRVAVGYVFGQLMFTPDDLPRRGLIRDDRPYAGYLYLGVYGQRADRHNRILDHVQLDLGVIGPLSGAEGIQKSIHKWFGATDPNGWDSQLDDRFTAQLTYRRKWRLLEGEIDLGDRFLQWEATPQAGFALGTIHRNLETAATLRIGGNLPNDFGPGRINDLASATGDLRRGWGAYAFGRIGGRIVEHNLFLTGNNDRTGYFIETEPLVGEVQLGASVQYRREDLTFEAGYAQTFLTDQFERQDRADSYATLNVSLMLEF